MLGYCYAIYRHATSVDCRGETDDVVNGGIVKALAVERVAARWLAARADRLVA